MYCIVSSSSEIDGVHKLKRESCYLWRCDGVGDFGLRRFFSKGGGSKVIGSSE